MDRGSDHEDVVQVGGHRPGAPAPRHPAGQQRPSGFDSCDAEDLAARLGLQAHNVANHDARLAPLDLAAEHRSDGTIGGRTR